MYLKDLGKSGQDLRSHPGFKIIVPGHGILLRMGKLLFRFKYFVYREYRSMREIW